VTFSAYDAEAALLQAGVPFVRLLGEGVEPGVRVLLVRRGTAPAVEQALETTPWRYRARRGERHRLVRQTLFTWDGGASVAVLAGLPAAPLPARALALLEDRVWRGARPAGDGVPEPADPDALVVAAVQVVRPGFRRPLWRRQFLRLAGAEDAASAGRAAATKTGLGATLELARRLVGLTPERELPRRTLRELVWAGGRRLQRVAPTRKVAALLDGAPVPGHAVFRTRFAGVEVDSGEGVFLPVPFSETLLDAGLERIAGSRSPTVLDIGTGCGAVALALASARGDADVVGIDVSSRALRWARRNARRLDLRNVRFRRGSLLEPVSRRLERGVDAVLTNVPYVPPAYRRASWDDIPGTVQGEGEDGLGLQRRLAAEAHGVLRAGGWLVAQVALEQTDRLRADLEACGYVDPAVVSAHAGDAVVAARRADDSSA
jgi:release factor glutamine methyltransferase